MGISYKAVVRPRLTPEKCLKDVQRVTLKMPWGGLLGDPLSEKEGRSDVKIRSIKSKGSPAWEKGHFKRIGQCSVP